MSEHWNQHQQRVRQHLHQQLLEMSPSGFEQLIAHLLIELGYNPVEIKRGLTPGRRSRKGRNAHGGIDLLAYTTTELTAATTAVQVKQYRRPVARHFVDSLRGAMLRTQAREGLLITTSAFSRVARQAAQSDHIAPIRLVEGKELINLLIAHNVGVKQQRSGRLAIDQRFLQGLQATCSPQHHLPPHEHSHPSSSTTSGKNTPHTQNDLTTNQRKEGGMTWSTHVMAGLNALWLLQSVPGGITAENIGMVVAGAALGALLPDLDAAESKIKHLRIIGIQPFAPIAVVLYRGLGHRGLLHSLLGLSLLTLFSLLFIPWWGWQTSAALVLGYASHLVADAATRSGVPLFYPDRKRYHLLPQGLRFTTGSQAEDVLFVTLAMTAMLLFLSRLFPGQWLLT